MSEKELAGHTAPTAVHQSSAPNPIAGMTEGRVVHFVLPDVQDRMKPGEHRAANVVRVWRNGTEPTGCVNLQVLLDGTNDLGAMVMQLGSTGAASQACERGTYWATSVTYDPTGSRPYTWHWPERA